MAVPLTGRSQTVGVLVVYCTGSEGIDDRRSAALNEIAGIVGYAVEARDRTRAVAFDTRTEVDIGLYDTDILFEQLSGRLDRPVTLEGCHQKDDGDPVLFLSVDTDDPETVCDVMEDQREIEGATVLLETVELCMFQVRLAEPIALIDVLIQYGATIRLLTSDGAETEFTVELPSTVSVRSFVETLNKSYPYAELLARRDKSDSAGPQNPIAQALSTLTERQLEIFQTAYFARFFEWPRPTSGEDLASMLEIAPPTFHQHLRTAERKIAAALLDS